MQKKVICCILALLLMLPCFCGCKFMTLSDEEARAELEKLLPAAKELTDIFYGEGLPYEQLPADSTDYYAFVTKDAPYQSVTALKQAAQKVFSTEYLESIYEYAFEGSDYYSSRYFMSRDSYNTLRLKINLNLEPMPVYQEIDLDSVKVIEGTPATVTVQVNAVNAKGQTKTKKITMVKQGDVWLLDSAAY